MLRPDEDKHFTDFDQIKKDVFILLNLGYGFNRLLEDSEGDVVSRRGAALFREYGKMYANEISSRLLKIAATSRILDDKLIKSQSNSIASKFAHDEDILGDDGNDEPINLRHCFNKIIHASSIAHELQLPEVCLSGEHQNGKEWSVRIFLLPFCRAIYEWIDHCQDSFPDTGNRSGNLIRKVG